MAVSIHAMVYETNILIFIFIYLSEIKVVSSLAQELN